MIIHPPYPPLIMAALDAHLRHLALALFSPIVCITTQFNGLFSRSWGGWRQRRAGKFPRVSSRWGPSKEPLGRSNVIVIDGTMFKWRAEGAGSGGSITHYWMPALSSHTIQLSVWWLTNSGKWSFGRVCSDQTQTWSQSIVLPRSVSHSFPVKVIISSK